MVLPDHDARDAPRMLRPVELAGLAAAAWIALAWSLSWPGSWSLRRCIDPEPARRAREVALHASARLAEFAEENSRAAPGSVVFLGSSTIERMPLAELFPGKPVLQRGIARASVPELLGWLDRILPSAAPAGFVVYAGSVDLREERATEDEVVARIERLLGEINRRAPAASIALVGILPDRSSTPEARARLGGLDVRLASLARGPVSFVATLRAPLRGADGDLSAAMASDALHLNREGYAVLGRWIVADGGDTGRLLAP